MRLVHYSNQPLGKLRRYSRPTGIEKLGDWWLKPRGLWVSDDDQELNWRTWCLEEDFHTENLSHPHDIELRPDANVLILRTVDEVMAFHEKWGRSSKDLDHLAPTFFLSRLLLPWPAITAEYDGLIITPYQWKLRLDLGWYYGWDVAGGCIWHPKAIASITLREASHG